jgi:hypothetical protein
VLTGAFRMHNTFGNAFAIEVRQLVEQHNIL